MKAELICCEKAELEIWCDQGSLYGWHRMMMTCAITLECINSQSPDTGMHLPQVSRDLLWRLKVNVNIKNIHLIFFFFMRTEGLHSEVCFFFKFIYLCVSSFTVSLAPLSSTISSINWRSGSKYWKPKPSSFQSKSVTNCSLSPQKNPFQVLPGVPPSPPLTHTCTQLPLIH